MLQFILKRLTLAPLVLWVLITISFFLIRAAPGDPFSSEKELAPEVLQAYKEKYHLDKPLFDQYIHFFRLISQGDLGLSMRHKERTVNDIIFSALPPSLYLGFLSLSLALILGIGTGVLAAVKQNTKMDFFTMAIAVIGISLPAFLIGPMLQIIFARYWSIFPISGYDGGALPNMVLPALTLALPFAARIARLTRSGMLDTLNQDYIRTAKAKGLLPSTVIWKHAFRGGIIPVISFLGPAIASITTGSLVVEKIFNLPGLGREFIESATNRDFSLVLGTVILYGTFIVTCNLISDLLHSLIDPRVRLS